MEKRSTTYRIHRLKERIESASVVFLLIVLCMIIRPVSPLLLDTLGHNFWAEQHHKMLHINGNEHLDEDLKEAQNANTSNSRTVPVHAFSFEMAHGTFIPSLQLPDMVESCIMLVTDSESILLCGTIRPLHQPPRS